MVRLGRQWARWVIGAWAGSSAERVEMLSGVEDIAQVVRKKKIRWAAPVYGRHLPILRETAQEILHQVFEMQNIQWNWMAIAKTSALSQRKEISIREWQEGEGVEYSDGMRSRAEGAAAGATTHSAEYVYLRRYATVMDAEMLGIALSLEARSFTVALDSQAAITRATQLYRDLSLQACRPDRGNMLVSNICLYRIVW